MTARKICVLTGTRAEYGLLSSLMGQIKSDPSLHLQLLVTGSHLSEAYGSTYKLIETDGFSIDEKIEILTGDDSQIGVAKSMALATEGIASALSRLRPDVLVLLGDRYEILAAAQAALVMRVPVAHIHGGEVTMGAIDESIRHAVTKLSQLHFTAAEPYRSRVIQLGERPERVFNCGAPGLDLISKTKLMTREELSLSLEFDLSGPYLLIGYHPETLDRHDPTIQIQSLLKALERFPNHKLVITAANADSGGRSVNEVLRAFAQARKSRVTFHSSLGHVRYLSALKLAEALIGNSSSGIIEAPFLKTPTVNIGKRQEGRLRATSVVDVESDTDEIVRGIETVLRPDFRARLLRTESCYGIGQSSEMIKEALKTISLDRLLMKPFHDIPVPTESK